MKYLMRAFLAFLLMLAPTFVEVEIRFITAPVSQQCDPVVELTDGHEFQVIDGKN